MSLSTKLCSHRQQYKTFIWKYVFFIFPVWAHGQRKWHANLSGKLTSKLCCSYARLNMLGASGSSRCLRIIVKIVYNKLSMTVTSTFF